MHSYSSIFHLGHKSVETLFNSDVLIEEKIDGCVVPNTPILTADLKYVPAGSLKVGDRLVAFQDKLSNPRLFESVVTASRPIKKTVYGELFKQAWPQISRGIAGGFPEFYKSKLAEAMFQPEGATNE